MHFAQQAEKILQLVASLKTGAIFSYEFSQKIL